MQINTCKESCCSSLIPSPPCFITPSYFLAFLAPMPKFSKNSKCLGVRERESNEIAPKNALTKSYPLILRRLFINEASIFFIFHYFPSFFCSHATCDVRFHFLLFSIIVINKMPINASCLSKYFFISFSIFL